MVYSLEYLCVRTSSSRPSKVTMHFLIVWHFQLFLCPKLLSALGVWVTLLFNTRNRLYFFTYTFLRYCINHKLQNLIHPSLYPTLLLTRGNTYFYILLNLPTVYYDKLDLSVSTAKLWQSVQWQLWFLAL